MFLRGATPLTAKLHKPVLVDALTGEVTASRNPPWYLVLMQLAQPLHFGDYGGWPLQILWAALDLITIVVLVSGLWLWWTKHRRLPAPAPGRARAAPRRVGRLRRSTWGVPAGLAAVAVAGLLAGLLGGPAGHLAAWLGLGAAVAVCARFGVRLKFRPPLPKRRRRNRNPA